MAAVAVPAPPTISPLVVRSVRLSAALPMLAAKVKLPDEAVRSTVCVPVPEVVNVVIWLLFKAPVEISAMFPAAACPAVVKL